jgi:AcrR family transcriptional regulator
LAAAARLFVESGYERTTIRGIAAAAEVDAGLVMHYFGTKQQLFQQVTHGRTAPELAGTAQQVSEQLLAQLVDSMTNAPMQSLAILRSMLTNPEAAETVEAGVAHYRAQISRAIGTPDADLRAALTSALILGVIVSRHLLKSDDLADASPAKIIDLLRPCFGSLMATEPDEQG